MAMTYNEIPEKSDLSCEGCCFSKEIMKPVTRKGAIAKQIGSGQWGCFAPLKEPFMSCKKPTAYFFVNCTPTHGYSYQKPKKLGAAIVRSKSSKKAGLCSEERSMITSDYARNFIHDFILGLAQKNITQLSLLKK